MCCVVCTCSCSWQVLKHKQTQLDQTVLRNELHDLQGMVLLEMDTVLDKFNVLEDTLGPQPRMRDTYRPSVIECARASLAGTPIGTPLGKPGSGARPGSRSSEDPKSNKSKSMLAKTGFALLSQNQPDGMEPAHNLHHTESHDHGGFHHQHGERCVCIMRMCACCNVCSDVLVGR